VSIAVAAAGRARIGRFEIIRVLGKGAQGTVCLAQDSHLERPAAV
jgi:serine/threonine protein kinase